MDIVALLPSLNTARLLAILGIGLSLALIYLTFKNKSPKANAEEHRQLQAIIRASKQQIKKYKKR